MSTPSGQSVPTPYLTVGGTQLPLPSYARPDLAYFASTTIATGTAGSEVSISPPGNLLYVPVAATCTFTTDNNVADRIVFWDIEDTLKNSTIFAFSPVTQAASLEKTYNFNVQLSVAYATGAFVAVPVPASVVPATYTIAISSTPFKGGDVLASVIFTYLAIPTGPALSSPTAAPVATPVLA